MSNTDKLIFVVEPSDETAREVVEALSRAGYEVKRFKEAQEAIDGTHDDLPDLITFSAAPDGCKLTKYLQANPPAKKIILLPRPELLDLHTLIQNNLATTTASL